MRAWALIAASFGLGIVSCVPQQLVPFAAVMSRPTERGRSVGTVVSGIMVGILLGRTIAGVVGELQASSGSLAPETIEGTTVEAVLAAEGSDWCWWYGPEHSSANDADFDVLYRKHLTEIYNALGEQAPEALAHPIKRAAQRERREPVTVGPGVVGDSQPELLEVVGAGHASGGRPDLLHSGKQ